MAFNLQQLTKPDGNRPIIATIAGEGGMGKTTLASYFPKPVILRVEDGTQSLTGRDDVALMPVVKSVGEVFEQIEALSTQDHDFKTLVIDSVTQFNVMAEAEIIAQDEKAKSIATAMGGYGAGYSALSEYHGYLRKACGELSQAKNMNIVFISHVDSETLDLPDSDPYSRYTMRLHKKSVSHYIDNVDLVAYIGLKRFLKGDKDSKIKKAVSTGDRVITCYPTPSHISKNRFGIKEDLDFTLETNPFAQYLNYQELTTWHY